MSTKYPGAGWKRLVLLAVLAALAPPLSAQSAPSLEGQVTGVGGRPLSGALVRVTGASGNQTMTNADGAYRIIGLGAGSLTLEVTLIGFQTQTATVNLPAGQTLRYDFVMEVSPLAMEGIMVYGQVGQAEALNRQRTAPSVRNVVSSEQIERFPDATVPDALRRIPGVSARPDRGETGFIFIRGLSPDLTTVTINGARLPSTAQEGRGVELSSIPAEMLESIEVIKAITPDMHADAVAGSINLQARRPTRPQFDGRLESGSHSLAGGSTYRGALTWGDVAGPISYNVGGDVASQVRSTENTQYTWGSWQGQTVLNRLMLQQYPIDRTRYSVNGTVNYTLDEDSEFFVRGLYSRYDTEEERHRLLYRLDQGSRTSASTATNARTYRQARRYKWEREIWDFTAGGLHSLGNLTLDYHGSVAMARRTEPYRNYFFFRQTGVDILADPSGNVLFPVLGVTNAKDVNNLSDFRLMEYEWRLDANRDDHLAGGLNLRLPFQLDGGAAGTIKFGASIVQREKERDTSEAVLDQITGTFTMAPLGTSSEGRAITSAGYPMGPLLDWSKGAAFYDQNRQAFSGDPDEAAEAAHTEDYVARERVAALYAMTTAEFGLLEVIAGARYEHTTMDYDGKRLSFDANGAFQQVVPSKASASQGSIFPALHMRYRVDGATNVRFAATRTIARPDFLDLAPNEYIRSDDEVVRRGNPELAPATSFNLDLLFERYFASIGLVQAGLFRKDIRDFSYTASSTIASGPQSGFQLLTPMNGARAEVYGAEAAWQQRLAFLPGALSGLGVYGNVTLSHSSTDFGIDGGREVRLPEQMKQVANVALTYDLAGFSALVSANHQSNFIDQVGRSADTDRFGQKRTQIDANVSQQITSNVRAIVQLNNLTNEPYIKYVGSMATPHENEFEGFWGSVGLRFNLR